MSVQLLQDFKNQMDLLLTDLTDVFPEEGDLVFLKVFLINQISIQQVMGNFIKHVVPLKKKIKRRDATFFLENDNPFGSLPAGKVGQFRKMWLSTKLSNEDRDMIWDYFDVFIHLAETYKKANDM